MEWGTIVGLITAIATVITAIGGLIAVVGKFLPLLKATRADVKDVHKIVNQQRTDMQNYQRTLTNLLKAHGIDVPEDQSKVQSQGS